MAPSRGSVFRPPAIPAFDPKCHSNVADSNVCATEPKAFHPDFDVWYEGWRKRLRADPLMRWMVDARNKIEKEGDLQAHSFVRAEIIASYLDAGPRIDLSARLFEAPLRLLKSIPDTGVGEHICKHGTLRIQRRWVENTLPHYELLDAVAIAYGRLSDLRPSGCEGSHRWRRLR